MTDYIAFKNDEPISIYDYKDLIETKPEEKQEKLYCICGDLVYFKNESKYFKRKNSNNIIQNICHFSHYKNSNCGINKIFKLNNNFGTIISPAPNKSDMEKRMERIDTIINGYFNGCKRQEEIRYRIIELSKIIKINNLNIILPEHILQLQNNYYNQITFRGLEHIDINHKERYILIDLISNEKNKGITYNLYYYICNDYNKFKIYVKKLSLIILYYSRCINYDINGCIKLIYNNCIFELEKKKKDNPDNPITIKYLNYIKEIV